MAEIRKILAMCGITRCCQEVIDYSIAMARNNNAELFFIHIIHNPFGLEGWNLPMMSLDDDYFNLLNDLKDDLEKIVAEEKKNGLMVRGLIKEGRPTDVILKTIREEKIDLLIMHAHEETRVERLESRLENFLFGASKEEIIRKMPCSILLLKRGPDSECA